MFLAADAHLAIGCGAALGGLTAAGNLGLLLSYGAMIASQTSGPRIIALLHNATAGELAAAVAEPDDVSADLPLEQLCAGYEAHHYLSVSNALHAAGMILALGMLVAGLWRPMRHLPHVPPTWYLFAWAGHFAFQADVPAVFTYGMTLRGWASGEWCSLKALFALRTVNAPLELALTAAIICAWFTAAHALGVVRAAPARGKAKGA